MSAGIGWLYFTAIILMISGVYFDNINCSICGMAWLIFVGITLR